MAKWATGIKEGPSQKEYRGSYVRGESLGSAPEAIITLHVNYLGFK